MNMWPGWSLTDNRRMLVCWQTNSRADGTRRQA